MPLVNEAFVLELDPDDVRARYAAGGIELEGDPLVSLAEAIASSPAVPTAGASILVVKTGPRGALAAIGRFAEADRPRMEALGWQVDLALRRLRYIGPDQVRSACERLAALLVDRLGTDAVRSARFTAVPRGGLIVLGTLSYLLDLSPDQIGSPEPGRLTVHVDDCAISGMRTREVLREANGPVVFAHLFSHPELRAIIEAEERVEACVSSGDLEDHAPEHHGDGYSRWRHRWLERRGAHVYWVGQPDHLCFPWNEPDVGIWNGVREREEPGWRVVPPSHCLKNNRTHGSEYLALQIQPEPAGPLRPRSDVLFGRLAESVVVARPAQPAVVSFAHVAADIWYGIVKHGAVEPVVDDILAAYSADPESVANDVRGVVSDLVDQGLLDPGDVDA